MRPRAQPPSRFPALLAEVRFHLKQGPWRTGQWILDRLQDRKLDRAFGIGSAKRRSAVKAGFDSPDIFPYQAVSYRDLPLILERLRIQPRDVFLDFGAGMGRAVCLAATYAFRSVIGIEISEELCAIARQNVALIKHRLRCEDVRIETCDARHYEIPANVSIVYFFNPFGGALLATVLENIGESLRRSPRPMQIVFCGTVSSEHFEQEAMQHPWLELRSRTVLPTGAIALSYCNTLWS